MKKKRLIFVLLLISTVLIIGMIVFVHSNKYIDLSKEDDAKIVFALEVENRKLDCVVVVAMDNRGTRYQARREKEDYQGVIKTCEQALSEKPNQIEMVTVEEVEHAYQLLLGLNKYATERYTKSGDPAEKIRWYGIRYKKYGPPEKVTLVECTNGPNDKELSGESAKEIRNWINNKWAPYWIALD